MENPNPIQDMYNQVMFNQDDEKEPSEKFILINEYFEKEIETKTDLTVRDINKFRKLDMICRILETQDLKDVSKILRFNSKYTMKLLISKYRKGRKEFVDILKQEPLAIPMPQQNNELI